MENGFPAIGHAWKLLYKSDCEL